MKMLYFMFLLILMSAQTSYMLSSKYKFFHFVFFLIYVGAILALILYVFFTSSNIKFKIKFIFLLMYTFFFLFLKKFQASVKTFSGEFLLNFFNYKELSFSWLLCSYVLFMLFSMFSLDQFRFSSFRSLF